LSNGVVNTDEDNWFRGGCDDFSALFFPLADGVAGESGRNGLNTGMDFLKLV
jgi:hypothetical protein